MKRMLVLTGLVTIAVAASASAIGVGEWNGDINGDPRPGSGIAFNVKKANSARKVTDVVANGLEYTCDDESADETSGLELEKSFPVDENGEFGGKSSAVLLGFDPPAKVTGRLKPGGEASGTIRVHGVLDPKTHPGLKCDTGTLHWKAERGPL